MYFFLKGVPSTTMSGPSVGLGEPGRLKTVQVTALRAVLPRLTDSREYTEKPAKTQVGTGGTTVRDRVPGTFQSAPFTRLRETDDRALTCIDSVLCLLDSIVSPPREADFSSQAAVKTARRP